MSTHHSVSILEFRKNIYRWLDKLPLEVTAKGRVLFKVVSPDGVPVLSEKATPIPISQAVKKTKEIVSKYVERNSNRSRICPKHGGQLLGGKYTCCE